MFKTLARKHGRVRHGYHTDTAAYVSQGKQKNKKKQNLMGIQPKHNCNKAEQIM